MQPKRSSRFSFLVFCAAVLLPLAVAAQQDLARLVLEAPLIFRGTVVGAASTALPLPMPNGRVFRVRVDQTVRGADSVGDFAGQEVVLVRTTDAERKEAIFFVRPFAYGKTLAAEVIGELDVPADTKGFAAQVARIEQQDADARLLARAASADAVIVGRVLAVEPVRGERGLPSEHDPEWVVAQVAVVRAIRGQPKARTCGQGSCVEVAFAQSKDIRWFRAPKLAPGQEAVFLLRPAQSELLREGEEPPAAYVLMHPDDLRPVSEETRLRELIRRNR